MADATAEDVENAILAALKKIEPSGFRFVGRIEGEPTVEDFGDATYGHSPAALLAWEGEDGLPGETVATLAGVTASATRITWRVFVVVQDPRGDEAATTSAGAELGLTALCAAVRRALAGLPVAGAAGSGAVTALGTRPVSVEHAVLYARAVRVSADVYDPQVGDASDARDFALWGGASHLHDGGGVADPARDPFETFLVPVEPEPD